MIVLILTLIVICWYTIQTARLAEQTCKSVLLQSEEIGLKKRPIVTILCLEKARHFQTIITNHSLVHSKARVKATVTINTKVLSIPKETHYSGDRIWQLQADSQILGHLEFPKMYSHNNMGEPPESELQGTVIIEAWVINFYDDESGLYDDKNKNPIAQWDWNNKNHCWVPEVAPEV